MGVNANMIFNDSVVFFYPSFFYVRKFGDKRSQSFSLVHDLKQIPDDFQHCILLL